MLNFFVIQLITKMLDTFLTIMRITKAHNLGFTELYFEK